MNAETASSTNYKNSQWKGRKKDTTQTDNNKQGRDERVFSCPACEQKLRVVFPLPGNIGKCTRCRNNFKVSSDESRNIYIYAIHDNQETTDTTLTIDKCFQILGIKTSATHSKIKRAYKIKMKEYHPVRQQKKLRENVTD